MSPVMSGASDNHVLKHMQYLCGWIYFHCPIISEPKGNQNLCVSRSMNVQLDTLHSSTVLSVSGI